MRDGKTCAVTFTTPLSPHIYGGSYSMPRFKLANFKGALDAPGEFFFDKKKNAQTLWYCPREGEDIKTAEIFFTRFPTCCSKYAAMPTRELLKI